MATSTIAQQQRASRAEGREPSLDLDYRPSYLAGGVVSFLVLLLYLVTLAPSTAMWDTSEYIAAAYTLGLPHPPGNPLFVLIGRVFSVLPIAPNVAMRVNVLAAVCSAGSVGMWWYYFKWQWLRDAHVDSPGIQAILAATFLVLGLFGGWIHYKRDRRSFWYFGTLMFSMTLLLIYYLNFKYGATQAPELGNSVEREVRDRDYFYLWSFSAWGVWAGLGLLYIWESLSSLFGTEKVKLGHEVVEEPSKSSWLKGSPVLALALIPLFTNWSSAPRKGQTDTRDFATDLLNSVEPYGVLVVVGDNDTFPLWYAQEVEGVRKDVVVANTSLLNTDWYTRQLIRRPVYEYDAAKGPEIYRHKKWPKPAGPPLRMTPQEADSVPPYMMINKPMQLKL